MSAAAVILAAGASRRLGRPKQTVLFAGETLLERAVRLAHEACLSPVIVVLRPDAEFAQKLRSCRCLVVFNEQAEEGMGASIRCGVAVAIPLDVSGAVLMTCDQVAVTSEHLRALHAEPAATAGSGYAGKVGIPAYFPAASFMELMKLMGDTGARDLLRGARAVPTEALAFDVDTEEDVERARRLFEG
jgi:molybdenum cofactor cytidylyltransferase